MTNFTWAVKALYTQTIEGEQDYVVIADYTLSGVDGEYEASIPNIARFSTEIVSEFIPYADLTEAIVIGWIQEDLGEEGVANLEASVQGQIDSQINPPVSPVLTPLPF